ncbi:hypothetical protein BH11ARM2_BH11ARM2_24870 [soil metagenome]
MEVIRPVLVLLALVTLAGCGHDEGREPLTNDKMAAEVKDKDLPLDQRIKNVQDNPNIPAPEKDRMIRLLQQQAGQSGQRQ